jgi:hypothetical protein
MILSKIFERIKFHYFDPSKIYKNLKKYQPLQKLQNYDIAYLVFNGFFHLTTAEVIPELQNKTSEKAALQRRVEAFEW